MVQDISQAQFSHADVARLSERLAAEPQLARQTFAQGGFATSKCSKHAERTAGGAVSQLALLFGRTLWHETRIPLFEQSVDCGSDVSPEGRRVSFG